MFRRLKNSFKEQLYMDDLRNALLVGLLNMLVFALFSGAVQYFVSVNINLEFGILIYLVAFMIGKKILDNITTYHIWYAIISVVYFIIGYIFYKITYFSFLFNDFTAGFKLVFSSGFSYFVFPFFDYRTYTDGTAILNNILDTIIFIASIITAWQIVGKKKH